jgi:hypothetical protein
MPPRMTMLNYSLGAWLSTNSDLKLNISDIVFYRFENNSLF